LISFPIFSAISALGRRVRRVQHTAPSRSAGLIPRPLSANRSRSSDPDPDNSDIYQAVIPPGGSAAYIDIAPLNDTLVEGEEDVRLTLLADQNPDGPFYHDPAQNGAGMPVMAMLKLGDVDLAPPVDPNKPTEAQIQEQIDLYDGGTQEEKDQAELTLSTWFQDHPSIESILDDKLASAGDEAIPMLQRVLGPVRLSLDAQTNSILVTRRFLPEGVSSLRIEFPNLDQAGAYAETITKNSRFDLDASPRTVKVKPFVRTQRHVITVTIT
jgi:hypothetical protein